MIFNKTNSIYEQVAKLGEYVRSGFDFVDNTYIYEGKDNPITMSRTYDAKFLCKYDLREYPFDTQVCFMEFIMKGSIGTFIRLEHGERQEEIVNRIILIQ